MNKNPEYNFTKEITSKLSGFKTYLVKLGNAKSTIRQKTNYAGYFLKWSESENLQVEEVRYNDLLNFIDYCKLEGKSKANINFILNSTGNYYTYLKKNNQELINPAINLRIKGVKRKIPSNIISFAELENFYKNYKASSLFDKCNKVILGLLIYQGVNSGALHDLEAENLNLREGKIYIPGNRKRNSRKLELKSFQILDLHEYLNEVRPEILKELSKIKSQYFTKNDIENKLFLSVTGSDNIKNRLYYLFISIRETNPEILNPKQIRTSVIVHWLKNYNLRQVQYMAGHKCVSTTERYLLNNIDSLQSKIEKFHPLK